MASDIIHQIGRCSELTPLSLGTVIELHARGNIAEELAGEAGADWTLECGAGRAGARGTTNFRAATALLGSRNPRKPWHLWWSVCCIIRGMREGKKGNPGSGAKFSAILTGRLKICTALPLLFAVGVSSCMGPTKIRHLDLAKVTKPEKERIAGLTTVKGEDVAFDQASGYLLDGVVKGNVRNAQYSIPVDQVQRLWVYRQEFSPGRTTALVVGVTAGVAGVAGVAIALANGKRSAPANSSFGCPFVYSWNGAGFVFDGEMYGGSVTRGMERDDTTELGQLRPENGVYRITLSNEMAETEFTNLAELWVVDHPLGTRVAADESGKLYTLSDSRPPTAAFDQRGTDLLPLLGVKDKNNWDPTPRVAPDGSVRHEITMTFPRPAGANEGKLVVSGGTGRWGIALITELFGLYGQGAAAKLASLDNNASDLKALQAWSTREDVYMMRVSVKEPAGWRVRGVVIEPVGGHAPLSTL